MNIKLLSLDNKNIKTLPIADGWFIFKYNNVKTWFLYKRSNDKMFTLSGEPCSWMAVYEHTDTPPREVIVKAKLLAGGI